MPNRPPFTGIHEFPPERALYGPHEGGGNLPPYGEDLFQRIVDVNWGGGGAVFVSGDFCCYLRTASMSTATLDQKWVGLSSLFFGDGGGNYGSSYAVIKGRPTFLMCGQGDGGSNNTFFGGIIGLSHDGTHWSMPFFDRTNRYGAIHDLVWDGRVGRFYAQTRNSNVFSSLDGYVWSTSTEKFYDHCTNGIPDGNIGYNPASGKTITPFEATMDLGGGRWFYANCTAFCGGIWLAGGYILPDFGDFNSATTSSIDDGKTWQVVTDGALGMHGNYELTTIIGALIGDF